MAVPDLVYLAILAVLLLVDHFLLWPAFLRRFGVDPYRARRRLWSGYMVIMWTLVAGVVALWLLEGRSWGALRLVAPHGWRLWGSLGLVVAFAIFSVRPVVRIARTRRRIKMGNPHVEKYSPHTRSELGWWVAASLSAGFCEELVFRGYLIWAFQPMLGLWGAAAFSLVVFAAGHSYQGAKGLLASGAIGGLLTLVVLILGSLLPAMALHAIVDASQGVVAWLAFRKMREEDGPGVESEDPR